MGSLWWPIVATLCWFLSGLFLGASLSSLYWNKQFRKLLRESDEVHAVIVQLTAKLHESERS